MSSLYLSSLYATPSSSSATSNNAAVLAASAGYTTISGIATAQANTATSTANQIAALSMNLNARLTDATTLSTRVTDMNTLIGSMQTLTSTLTALRDSSQTAGITGTSSDTSVGVLVGANAHAGTSTVSVTQLAQAQINQSNAVASSDQAAHFGTGTVTIQEGSRAAISVNVSDTMSLSDIATAINGANANVTATVVTNADGTYQLQVTGNDTGSANGVAYAESGTSLGLVDNGVQAATDLQGTSNGVAFSSSSNTAANAIAGVSLSFSQLTSNDTVTLTGSSTSAAAGVQAFVAAYNTALAALNTTQTTQTEQGQLGTLRDQLALAVGSYATGAQGTYNALAQVGVSTAADGTLSIDSSALNVAASTDPNSVAALLSGNNSSNGLAAALQNVSLSYSAPATGILSQNQYALQAESYKNAQSILAESNYVDDNTTSLNANNTFYQVELTGMTRDALLVPLLPTS